VSTDTTDNHALGTVDEGAAHVGCSARRIWRLLAAKKLARYRRWNRTLVDLRELEALADQGERRDEVSRDLS
jgi:hypothetical protein